jgi:hypothetical protein
MMQRRLKEKIVSAVADFTDFDETFAPGADALFVTELYLNSRIIRPQRKGDAYGRF